jgi:acyl carrier protein
VELLSLKIINLNLDSILANVFAVVFEDNNKDFVNTKEKKYEKWDSLRGINLLLEVEKNFNIQITNDELLNFNSYSNIKKIIEKKLNE